MTSSGRIKKRVLSRHGSKSTMKSLRRTGNRCSRAIVRLRLSRCAKNQEAVTMNYPRAIRAVALEGYKLPIGFDNGETRIFDVGPYISGSWYGLLQDWTIFSAVRADGRSVVWPDGQEPHMNCTSYLFHILFSGGHPTKRKLTSSPPEPVSNFPLKRNGSHKPLLQKNQTRTEAMA